jgi:N-acetylmuramoyl-L-alanine amidase
MRTLTFFALLLAKALPGFSQDSILIARTTGPYVFMEYGIGDDRLGGAKIGFLDSNIVVKIVDSFNTDYKIRLSTQHYAYIAKSSLAITGREAAWPAPRHNVHLTGSIRVFGDSASDYVTLALGSRFPYRSMQLLDPSRVAVDVYGVTSNTNWITQLRTAKEIRNTWYEQVEDDVFRIYIQLRHPQHWGYAISYDSVSSLLKIRIRRQPPLDIRRLRIAIDAGHGGDNIGATGRESKIMEKEYTLLIAEQLRKALKTAGVKNIFMTRTKDTTLSMPERVAMLKAYDPHLLVSIHLNSTSSDTVEGVSTYYRYMGFRSLSVAILNRMLALGLKEHGNVGSFNFSLNGPTDYPNALVEVAFLSNPGDEKKILRPAFRKAVAQKIYLGIVDWLKQLQ